MDGGGEREPGSQREPPRHQRHTRQNRSLDSKKRKVRPSCARANRGKASPRRASRARRRVLRRAPRQALRRAPQSRPLPQLRRAHPRQLLLRQPRSLALPTTPIVRNCIAAYRPRTRSLSLPRQLGPARLLLPEHPWQSRRSLPIQPRTGQPFSWCRRYRMQAARIRARTSTK